MTFVTNWITDNYIARITIMSIDHHTQAETHGKYKNPNSSTVDVFMSKDNDTASIEHLHDTDHCWASYCETGFCIRSAGVPIPPRIGKLIHKWRTRSNDKGSMKSDTIFWNSKRVPIAVCPNSKMNIPYTTTLQ